MAVPRAAVRPALRSPQVATLRYGVLVAKQWHVAVVASVEGEWRRARRFRRLSRRRMRAASRRLARFSSRGVCGDGGRAAAAGTVAALGSIGLIVAACLFSSGSPAVADCLSSSDGVAVDGPAAADASAAVAGEGWMASVGPGVADVAVLASSRRRAAAARARIDRAIALSMRGCRRVNTTVSASVNSTSALPLSI